MTNGFNFRTCSQFKRLTQDKKLWSEAVFLSKDLDIWEILKRLKYLLVTTKTLKIQGNCDKNTDSRPMPNRQTFKEIIKRIVSRSPLIQHLHFKSVWFDWTRDVSRVNLAVLRTNFHFKIISVFNFEVPSKSALLVVLKLHHAEDEKPPHDSHLHWNS